MTNLDSIFKSRDITLPTKVCLVKAMVFPVVMYGCESWTVKKAERQRIDAFEMWYWGRLLSIGTSSCREIGSYLADYCIGRLVIGVVRCEYAEICITRCHKTELCTAHLCATAD